MNRLFRRVATGKLVENVGLYIQTVIMGFSTVLKLLAPLSNIVQCCSNNEHVGWGGGRWKFAWVLILYVLLIWMEVMKVSFRFELACEVIQLTEVQVWYQEGAGSLFIVH